MCIYEKKQENISQVELCLTLYAVSSSILVQIATYSKFIAFIYRNEMAHE